MVKNTQGGSKAKSQGRKFSSNYTSRHVLRLSQDTLEQYACVTKIYGNGRCQVHTLDGLDLHCIIRNKFRGRSKRNNIISIGTVLLVGLREWERHDAFHTCDVLEVYDAEDLHQLRAIPSIHIHYFDRFIHSNFNNTDNGDLDLLTFSETADSMVDYGGQKVVEDDLKKGGAETETEDINIDDI
jgi:hypothetical protein